jgi:hypothetical protein
LHQVIFYTNFTLALFFDIAVTLNISTTGHSRCLMASCPPQASLRHPFRPRTTGTLSERR